MALQFIHIALKLSILINFLLSFERISQKFETFVTQQENPAVWGVLKEEWSWFTDLRRTSRRRWLGVGDEEIPQAHDTRVSLFVVVPGCELQLLSCPHFRGPKLRVTRGHSYNVSIFVGHLGPVAINGDRWADLPTILSQRLIQINTNERMDFELTNFKLKRLIAEAVLLDACA